MGFFIFFFKDHTINLATLFPLHTFLVVDKLLSNKVFQKLVYLPLVSSFIIYMYYRPIDITSGLFASSYFQNHTGLSIKF